MNRIIWWIIATILLLLIGILLKHDYFPVYQANQSPQVLDYNFHIRPILSDKCFVCHGPDAAQREANLRLDTPEGAYATLKDQFNRQAIVPYQLSQSEVWNRINSKDETILMPPPDANLHLTQAEIALIGKWIEQGAQYKPHWAFTPIQVTELPKVKFKKWARNELDYFILAKLEAQRLKPNPEATKSYLLKRLSFDLLGLPPTLEQQTAFLTDNSEKAYEKMVDELLASPHFGEKMAIHWLDVARYADSHGYQDDGLRTMWPWRDWVIHAFNQNYTYDKFLTFQLAGDLLPDKTKESILATGFNRNHKITQEGGIIDEEYRVEYVTDRTNTFGKAFLALTFECAKCHDHKYDPISQQDYYSTFAFFNQVSEKGLVGDISLASLADPPKIKISKEEITQTLHFINQRQVKDTVEVMIMQDSVGLRPTRVLHRGNYDAPADTVFFGLPKAILAFDTTRFEPNRLGLAKWLLDKQNPLTARVFVNRLWQDFFGKGLVKTTGDFGMQGELPSHPELLDFLASDFQEHGWEIKRLIKQIVMSATYRQSAKVNKAQLTKDPENIYLSRSPRLRLSAELIRDHVLASSGLLHPEIGGPSVKTYQPDGIWESATSGRGVLSEYIQDHGNNLYRRGMYVFIKRTVPPPVMLMFDASNRDQCEVKRSNTSTPLQALVMLNDPHVLEAARVLAERLMLMPNTMEEKIEAAFARIICRPITEKEKKVLLNYLKEEQHYYKENKNSAEKLLTIGEYPNAEITTIDELAALMQIIHTIYNMEEAMMKT